MIGAFNVKLVLEKDGRSHREFEKLLFELQEELKETITEFMERYPTTPLTVELTDGKEN